LRVTRAPRNMSRESSASEPEETRPPDVPGMTSSRRHEAGAGGSTTTHHTRAHFQQQLQELEANALGGLDLIIEQLDRVLEALEHQDVELAQMVIADDDRVDGRYLEVHQGILSLLALQAPVAGDLRLVAALL